jgi:cytochrome c-type biogenesis protein CcmH
LNGAFPLFALLLWALAAALLIWLPRLWRRGAAPETNEDWLRLRQRELAGEAEAGKLHEEAALRLLEDRAEEAPLEIIPRPSYSGLTQLAGVAIVALSVWLLYRLLGGWEDVQIAEQLAQIEQSQREDVLVLIDRIAVRAEARPENADYALLLGEYYLSGNEPAEALRYYDRLIEAGATAPEILGKAAQSEFLSSDRVLSRRARGRAEQALAVDPMQAAALATLGMAAFEEVDYRQAIVYWQRLRELESPGTPGHDMLGQIIERARQELGEPLPELVVTAGVEVEISLSGDQPLPADSLLFVLARPEGAEAGMPIAVVRQTPSSWPLTVRLDDGASMAGQQISSFSAVSIEVQVSANGQPGRENALTWSARSSVPVGFGEPVKISLQAE